MSKRDELAIAYADARLEVLRLKRERAACHCERACCPVNAGDGNDDPGVQPCWIPAPAAADYCRRLSFAEMCLPCQRRQRIHEQLHAALRVEASALGKLRRSKP